MIRFRKDGVEVVVDGGAVRCDEAPAVATMVELKLADRLRALPGAVPELVAEWLLVDAGWEVVVREYTPDPADMVV